MRVVVVGAGIVGLCTAWALTRRGHEVALLEQGPIPNPLSASGDHHRIIRRAYGRASGYARMIGEAFDAWDELWSDLGETHYDPRGFMAVSREPGDEAEDYLEGMKAGGYPFEMVGPQEAAGRWPFLAPGTFRYAFVSPEGGALHCRKIAAGLLGWLRGKGCAVRENARVTAVDAEAASVMLETGERLAADGLVVAAGAWAPLIFPQLAAELAIFRTAVVYLEPPAELRAAWEAAPVILDVGGRTDGYIIPPGGGGGLKFGSGLTREKLADAGTDRAPRPGEGERIRDLFQPPIADVGAYAVKEAVSCVYTFTADQRFHAGRIGNALVVSACSGHGYKFGAAVGRRVADGVESGDVAMLKRWLRGEAA